MFSKRNGNFSLKII